ncbi:MAG: YdcF family protein [Hyphomicrobiaceae bacterium]|nr:YdcF family protein [Hyphomicrobiaceae bacterium]
MRQFLKTFALGVGEAFWPRRDKSGTTQIVPQSSVSGRALTAVISIMSFLACLTAGMVYMVNQSANAWYNDIASEVTVQVSPIDGEDTEQRLRAVTRILKRQVGIVRVQPYSLAESAALLEPWLGAGDTLSALPVPRLIAIEIDRNSPPDLSAIRQKLAARFKGVLLDDHRRWQAQIQSLTRSVALAGLGILLLVATATVAVIVSAARSAMASNHEIVEVLHFVGAHRKFIASEFERHFLALGIRSGLLGALGAGFMFFFAPIAIQLLGGGSVTASEIKQLVGSAELDFTGYSLLGLIVIAVAAICMFTSSYWVDRILNTEGTIANPNTSPDGGFSLSSRKAKSDSLSNSVSRDFVVKGIGVVFKAAVIASLVFGLGFVLFSSTINVSSTAQVTQADGIVVLTGGKSRINEGVRLLAAGKAKSLLISGVHAQTSIRQLSKLVPGARPLFNCCIDLGRAAHDTIGNAHETRSWARQKGYHSLIIVTSAYHMPRSMAEFRSIMPHIKLVPFAIESPNVKIDSWWSDTGTARLLFSEYMKYLPALTKLGFSKVTNLFAR